MTLTEDFTTQPLISSCTPEAIQIQDKSYETSIIIAPDGKISVWEIKRLEDITLYQCDEMIKYNPEIILIGTGPEHQFPDLDLIRHFEKNKLPIEIMSTSAACRTYNVLILENRSVFAALML